jgi:hypothetical protein
LSSVAATSAAICSQDGPHLAVIGDLGQHEHEGRGDNRDSDSDHDQLPSP